jgi:hypothetical protein
VTFFFDFFSTLIQKVLHLVTLCGKCNRALTFSEFCQVEKLEDSIKLATSRAFRRHLAQGDG